MARTIELTSKKRSSQESGDGSRTTIIIVAFNGKACPDLFYKDPFAVYLQDLLDSQGETTEIIS